jgi:hypothetical protein
MLFSGGVVARDSLPRPSWGTSSLRPRKTIFLSPCRLKLYVPPKHRFLLKPHPSLALIDRTSECELAKKRSNLFIQPIGTSAVWHDNEPVRLSARLVWETDLPTWRGQTPPWWPLHSWRQHHLPPNLRLCTWHPDTSQPTSTAPQNISNTHLTI